MITTGVSGAAWRASITPWGAVEPWGDGASDPPPVLDWFVAADDRWHVPSREPALRQQRVDGTPVTETRLRVPRGDVVQRVYSCADAEGVTVVEISNESSLPVAIAFSHRAVLTERPIADVPIEGIELPDDGFVMPLGHSATIRVGLSHSPGAEAGGRMPVSLPSSTQVVRGWQALTERASRLLLPEGEHGSGLAERVTAERCELVLTGVPAPADDPAAFAVGLGELVRTGERPERWTEPLADAVASIARVDGWEAGAGLAAAAWVLAAAGERRALRDLERIVAARSPAPMPAVMPEGVFGVAWLEARLASGGSLLPGGIPSEWLGQSIETYGLPTAATSSVSFAIRWHGARPAVLWEQTGVPVTLTSPVLAPGWSTSDVSGEALWPEPSGGDRHA